MNERKAFNPSKAKRVGGPDGVENIPFTEMQTQASIFNSLSNLRELFKGADPDDYDQVFGKFAESQLQEYRSVVAKILDNLERIIREKR